MAKKVVVQLVDDIDQEPIEEGGEHIRFAVGGVEYEIDLNDENAAEFHRRLDYYIDFATKVDGRRGRSTSTPSTQRRSPDLTKAVREWARENGHAVSARGRISAEIQQAYDAAHNG
jgi:hypothetical protein